MSGSGLVVLKLLLLKAVGMVYMAGIWRFQPSALRFALTAGAEEYGMFLLSCIVVTLRQIESRSA